MSLMDGSPDQDDLKFVIKSKGGSSSSSGCSPTPDSLGSSEAMVFVFACRTRDDRNQWYSAIKGILETQLDFLRALQSPIAYQKELTKDL